MKRITAILLNIATMCMLIASCANKPENSAEESTIEPAVISNDTTASSTTATVLIDDTIPDDYTIVESVPDGEYNGRVYQNQLFLNSGGKRYLVVGEYRGEYDSECEYDKMGTYSTLYFRTLFTDDDLKKMKAGDEFIYDHDIHFKIESMDVIDWHINDYTPDGKIRINKEYSLVHVGYRRNMDQLIQEPEAEMWTLVYEDSFGSAGCYRTLFQVKDIKMYELSDKIVFKYQNHDRNEYTLEQVAPDELDELFANAKNKSGLASCTFYIRQNRVVGVNYDFENM